MQYGLQKWPSSLLANHLSSTIICEVIASCKVVKANVIVISSIHTAYSVELYYPYAFCKLLVPILSIPLLFSQLVFSPFKSSQ